MHLHTAHEVATIAERAAERAGLAYVRSHDPGIRRQRSGRGFTYVDSAGKRVRDRETLARIRAIVVPPAWSQVWICERADGHIQATGRDARGRKQYRYHAAWRCCRDEAKFDILPSFAERLPALRDRVARDLRARTLCRHKVLATVVRLLETTLIRVGNEEYARANASYGLTTLEDRHLRGVWLTFTGKSGIARRVALDPTLARIVARCRAVPGPTLFQYYEGDRVRSVSSADVNAYIRAIAGPTFSAKCFRTWGATVLAAQAFHTLGPPTSARDRKRKIKLAMIAAAERLGNTPAVCKSAYVHPAVVSAFEAGTIDAAFRSHADPEEAVLALIAPRRVRRLAA
jgi:DNA topoisomerase-1